MRRIQAAFRLEDDLLDRVDRYVERMKQEQPGLTVSRSDVLRILVAKGLDVVETQSAKWIPNK